MGETMQLPRDDTPGRAKSGPMMRAPGLPGNVCRGGLPVATQAQPPGFCRPFYLAHVALAAKENHPIQQYPRALGEGSC